eukprot:gene16781-biopygen17315
MHDETAAKQRGVPLTRLKLGEADHRAEITTRGFNDLVLVAVEEVPEKGVNVRRKDGRHKQAEAPLATEYAQKYETYTTGDAPLQQDPDLPCYASTQRRTRGTCGQRVSAPFCPGCGDKRWRAAPRDEHGEDGEQTHCWAQPAGNRRGGQDS